MLVLALDTATPACSVAVVEIVGGCSDAGGAARTGVAAATPAVRTRAARSSVDAKWHGELLAASLRAVLAEAGLHPAELAAVVAGTGPGPYTSLRVGVVTAAAFAAAAGLPAFGVCSLDGIGLQAAVGSAPAGRGPMAVVTDARRREVFWAVYDAGRRTHGPAVGRPHEVVEAVRAAGAVRVSGPGALLYRDAFAGLLDPAAPDFPDPAAPDFPDPATPDFPDPATLAALAAPAVCAGTKPPPLAPIYLRRPDAAQPQPQPPGGPQPWQPGGDTGRMGARDAGVLGARGG